MLQDRVQFENIEFFLPQLSHMIINLHPDEYDVPLERLAVMISLVSPHTASLLTFALVAAMEDFQPELAHGEDNPNKNSKLYFRCAHLMKNIERAVVMHGSEKKLALEESSGSAYYTSAFEVFRYSRPITMDGKNAGELYYKRQYRKGALRSKPWKLLYFVIDEQVLFCYHDIYTPKPKRAFPLFNCKIIAVDNHPEFGNTKFEIEDPSSGVVYELRARSETERAEWIKKIKG